MGKRQIKIIRGCIKTKEKEKKKNIKIEVRREKRKRRTEWQTGRQTDIDSMGDCGTECVREKEKKIMGILKKKDN